MTAKEFLAEVGPLPHKRQPTETEIDAALELWSSLLDALEFQAGIWYERDRYGIWTEISSFSRVCQILSDLAIHDTESIIQGFRDRDENADRREFYEEPTLNL
jgi:hypothetical protein